MSYTKDAIKSSVLQRLEEIRNFLKSVNQCALCSQPLTLIHEINNTEAQVHETAYCSQCDLNVRKKEHGLH